MRSLKFLFPLDDNEAIVDTVYSKIEANAFPQDEKHTFAYSHNCADKENKGWEVFTDAIIEKLSCDREHLVFMLWGNYAKNKGRLIDRTRHLVLESAHPSPFSAANGFFGNKHFSATNAYLRAHGLPEIDWK